MTAACAPFHKAFSKADYVILTDVDEFIQVNVGDGTLNALIAAAKISNRGDEVLIEALAKAAESLTATTFVPVFSTVKVTESTYRSLDLFSA